MEKFATKQSSMAAFVECSLKRKKSPSDDDDDWKFESFGQRHWLYIYHGYHNCTVYTNYTLHKNSCCKLKF